jgi:hypothetical protein
MRLVATEQGRVLDLVPIEEIRSNFGIYLPELIRKVVERYEFAAGPENLAKAASEGAKFQHGHFKVNDIDVVIKELAIYNDGIIVDTFNSNMSDTILDDLLVWTKQTFDTKDRISLPSRIYSSVVVADFEHDVEPILGKFMELGKLVSKSLRSTYGWNYEYNLQRLALSVDPLVIPHLRNTQFFIERRQQISYSTNRYYCGAPLPTDQHIELLETMEQELLSL